MTLNLYFVICGSPFFSFSSPDILMDPQVCTQSNEVIPSSCLLKIGSLLNSILLSTTADVAALGIPSET